MAIVNVRVDCSPFGLGLPISLAGMEDMMCFPVGFQVRLTSFHQDLLVVVECLLWWVDCSYSSAVLSFCFYSVGLLRWSVAGLESTNPSYQLRVLGLTIFPECAPLPILYFI